MMRWSLLTAVLSPLLVLAPTAPAGQDPPDSSAVARAKPAGKVEFGGDFWNAFVTEIGPDSITVRSDGWTVRSSGSVRDPVPVCLHLQATPGWKITSQRVEGQTRVTTITIPPQPPKRFALSAELASGCGTGVHQYRLADVRVGDKVVIAYNRVNGVDICGSIQIERRPGGRVPVAPGDDPSTYPPGMRLPLPYHEKMNAYQDWEERGIPLPAELLGVGQYLSPPYPPVAPMPREVSAKP